MQLMCGRQARSGPIDGHGLANLLLKSFATIENEKDPTVLQKKLAEHGALLKELQTQLQGQSQMMEKMRGHMMMGHMMGGEQK